MDISVIRRKSNYLPKNAVFTIDNNIAKYSLLKTVSQVTCYFFSAGGTKLIVSYNSDVIPVHGMCKHTNSAVHIEGHNSRTKIRFIWDVTPCFWVCSFQNLDLDPEDEGSTILRNVGNCSPNYTESHFRRPESSATPQMSHIDSRFFYCSK